MAANDTATACTSLSLHSSLAIAVNVIIVEALSILVALMTIIGNMVFIITLARTSTLHTPSNVLLGALCLSDLLVGLIVQPIFLSFLIQRQIGSGYEHLSRLVIDSLTLHCGISCLIALLISVDRYAAICHPFRYRRLATCKKCTYTAVITVTLWFTYTIILQYVLVNDEVTKDFARQSVVVLAVLSTTVVIVAYVQIYRVVQKQRRAIVSIRRSSGMQCEVRREMLNRRRERDNTYTIAIIVGFFFVSYSPYIIASLFLDEVTSCFLSGQFVVKIWTGFFMATNSLTNPIIYCIRSSDIKRAAFRIFRTTPP